MPPLHPRCRCMIMYHEVKATVGNVGNEIKPNENYRQIIPELPYKPVSEERYNQLIIPLKKMGVTIHRDEDSERHLEFLGVEADTIGTHDVLFRKKVSISAILEETHHIRQNRRGMNDDKETNLRTILNEIDAKKHLLQIAEKYGIPRGEIEITKIQLRDYEAALKQYTERHGG